METANLSSFVLPENGGTYNVIYEKNAAEAAQFKIVETGAPTGTTFTYTVNGSDAVSSTYTNGSATIDAQVGDVVVITPQVQAGYALTGVDTGYKTKTITIDANTTASDGNVIISDNNTAKFIYAAIAQTITVKYVNEATGKQLGDSATINGVTGGTYTITPRANLAVNYVSGAMSDGTISVNILNTVNVFKLDTAKTGSLTGTYVDNDKTILTIYYAPENFSFKTEFFTKNADGSFNDVGEGTISYDATTDTISYDGPTNYSQPVSALIHFVDSNDPTTEYLESGSPASGVITATTANLNFNISPAGVLSFASATSDSTVPSATTQPYMEVNPKLTYGSITVNRTVYFEGAGAATPEPVTQTATYGTVTNNVTNETAYTLQSVKNIAIAAITGFTAMIGATPVKKNDDGSYSPVDFSDFDSAVLSTPTVPADITITYVANDETVIVTATGNTGDTGFTYTVNGGDPMAGSYVNGSINAKFGDTVIVIPGSQTGYTVTGNDIGVDSKTITVGDSVSDNSVAFIYTEDETVTEVPTDPTDPNYESTHQTITRTIKYTGVDVDSLTAEQKAALSAGDLATLTAGEITQTGTYTRTVTTDATTGAVVGYGEWTLTDNSSDADSTNDGFTAVKSPKVLGYTADKDAAAVTLSNDEVTNFVADSDNVTVTYTEDETVTVDPGDPKNPTDPIDPDNPDGPKYPSGVDENDLNKTVSRTITYTGADKNPASVTQTGKYQRTATVDTKTGELLGYGAWTLVTNTDADQTNDGFIAITSPKILGYTADKDVSAVVLSNDEVSNFVKNSDDQTVTYTSMVQLKLLNQPIRHSQWIQVIQMGQRCQRLRKQI
ncbi:hypothetical protein GA840_09635 [Pediococcus ethanolidurans]|uniref:mucin-binding protein n=1 Tax=Pediococcus ethanolidurans TaxID=319653 RepID=UPI002954E7D2|nr:MucBP domain-containing protein [Pediococcus ethanolidurans]MDV7720101.1 hypothetical protein [Pediococcus ethanolidurans]